MLAWHAGSAWQLRTQELRTQQCIQGSLSVSASTTAAAVRPCKAGAEHAGSKAPPRPSGPGPYAAAGLSPASRELLSKLQKGGDGNRATSLPRPESLALDAGPQQELQLQGAASALEGASTVPAAAPSATEMEAAGWYSTEKASGMHNMPRLACL